MLLSKRPNDLLVRAGSYLGGCVHAMENPKLDPEGFDNRLVIVKGVLPVLPSLLDDRGGSNSRYCKNLFSSLPGKYAKT